MLALYLESAGRKSYEVVDLLSGEYGVSCADVKLILMGKRMKLMTGTGREYELRERLIELGARAVVEVDPD